MSMRTIGGECFLAPDPVDGKLRPTDTQGNAPESTTLVLDALDVELAGYSVQGKRAGADDVEVTDPDRGLVLTSPNGHRWRMVIADNGNASWIDLDA